MAARFEVWRVTDTDTPKASGKIVRRDTSTDPYFVQAMTHEIELESSLTPTNAIIDSNFGSSVFGAGTRVKDVMEQLTYDYRSKLINRSIEDEIEANITDNANIDFSPTDKVALEKEDTGETEEIDIDGDTIDAPVYLYPAVEVGDESGRIGFGFELPEGYHPHRLRWKQEVGETNDILYRYRYSDDNGSTWDSWSDWPTEQWPQNRPEQIGFPLLDGETVDIKDATNVQIQLQLVNEDGGSIAGAFDRTEGTDEHGNEIVIYGSTPLLYAVEVICRQDGEDRVIKPHDTVWPSEDTPQVHNVDFDNETHINAAVTIADNYGYEFYVDHELKLRLQEEFGEDRQYDTIFREKDNMNIEQLEDDDSEMANILVCLGDGSGLDQLRTVVRDEPSIAEYGPRPATFANSDIDILSELETAGQAELERRKEPVERFYIHGIIKEKQDFTIGDTVGIALPDADVFTSGRIIEVDTDVQETERVQLGINDTLVMLSDELTKMPRTLAVRESILNTRVDDFRAKPKINVIELTWSRLPEADGVRIYRANDKDGDYRQIVETDEDKYIDDVTFGVRKWYKIEQFRNNATSPQAGPITAVAKSDNVPSTLVVAAHNTSERGKAGADFVCDGEDDQEKINAAIRELVPYWHYMYNEGFRENLWIEGYSDGSGTQSKETNHIFLQAGDENNQAVRTYVTEEKYSLTQATEIVVDWENTGDDDTRNRSYLVVSNEQQGEPLTAEATLSEGRNFSRTQQTLNVSGLEGEFYIRVHARDSSPSTGYESKLKVYQIQINPEPIGGKVTLLEGAFFVSGSIEIRTDIALRGQGNNSIIEPIVDFSDGVVVFDNTLQASLDDLKIYSENKDNAGVAIRDSCETIVISNCVIDNMFTGIFLQGDSFDEMPSDVKISGCSIKNNHNWGIDCSYLDGGFIQNNSISSNGHIELDSPNGGGISVGLLRDTTISGNRVSKNTLGISVVSTEELHIVDNNIKDNEFSGIELLGVLTKNINIDDLTLKDNNLIGNNQYGDTGDSSYFDKAQISFDLLIKNADIQDNHIRKGTGSAGYGIYISNEAVEILLSNNDFYESGSTAAILDGSNDEVEYGAGNRLNDGSWDTTADGA